MEHLPAHSLRIAELPPSTRTRAEKLAAFIREEFRALEIPLGNTAEDAEALKKLAMDPSIPDERLEMLEEATATLANILQGKEVASEHSGLGALSDWLKAEGLDSKLEKGSLDAETAACVAALEDGPMGFTPDLTTLTFPTDPATLVRLTEGLDSGALSGVILTAFPTLAQIHAMATTLGADPETLLNLPTTEFLVRHFEARGGKVNHRDERLKTWRTLKWPTDGQPLHAHLKAHGYDLAKTYAALPDQPCLRDALGQATITFTYTRREIDPTTPLFQEATVGDPAHITEQGKGLSFDRLARAGADTLTPLEWLALLGKNADPKDPKTYPTPWMDGIENWEWLAGITESSCAACVDSGSDGAYLLWDRPGNSDAKGRARSVLRGTPGL